MESRIIFALLFLAGIASAQSRVIGNTGEVLYYRTSNDTVYLSTTPITNETGVVVWRDTAYITEGEAADTIRVILTGVDSVVFTPPANVTLGSTTITGSANIPVSYAAGTDTFGILEQEMIMRAYYDGVSDTRVILLRTFDNFWSKAALTYTPDISISSIADITTARAAMRTFLYPAGYPTGNYDSRDVISNVDGEGDLGTILSEVNRRAVFRFNFDYHIWTNKVYRIQPNQWNGKAIFVAHGHWGTLDNSGNTDLVVNKLLLLGYEVFLAYMPHDGLASAHNSMEAEEGSVTDGRPLTAFVDHYIRCLNWIEDSLGITSVPMVGVSGGGWQVPITMAIDERVTEGMGFAGSYPLGISSYSAGSSPHYEQGNNADNFYADIASYEDLYLMGISSGRTMHLLHNPDDACCYGEKLWQQYRDTIQETAASLGGSVTITPYWPGNVHGFQEVGLNYILRNLE